MNNTRYKNQVNTELLSLLYNNSLFSLLASVVISLLLTPLFLESQQSAWPYIWVCAMVLLSAGRYSILRKFRNNRSYYPDTRWETLFYAGIFLSGCLWGSLGVIYNFNEQPEHWFFMAFIIAGISGGAVTALSPYWKTYLVLCITMFTPVMLNIYQHNLEHQNEMLALIVLYIVATNLLARRSNRFYRDVTLMKVKYQEMNQSTQENIDLLHKQQVAMQEQEQYLHSIVDTALEGILTMNDRGTIEMVNPAIEIIFGYTQEELLGQKVDMLMPDAIASFHQDKVSEYLNTGNKTMTGRRIETDGKRKDGTVFPISISVSDLVINGRHIFTSVISDITEQTNMMYALQVKNTELSYLSEHDELTGIYNRRSIDDYMKREWDRAHRLQSHISILMIDVDLFKKYNDRYGHQAGDKCLQHVAHTMRDCVHRATDSIGRYGGEEFIAILPETDLNGATEVAEKIRNSIASLEIPHQDSDHQHVTVSIGVATTTPTKTGNYEQLISSADSALYQAKQQGRNLVIISDNKPATS